MDELVYTYAWRQRKVKDGVKYKKEKRERERRENMSASLKARQRPFYTGVVHESKGERKKR